jgi:hypothetical protein
MEILDEVIWFGKVAAALPTADWESVDNAIPQEFGRPHCNYGLIREQAVKLSNRS